MIYFVNQHFFQNSQLVLSFDIMLDCVTLKQCGLYHVSPGEGPMKPKPGDLLNEGFEEEKKYRKGERRFTFKKKPPPPLQKVDHL